MIGIGISIPINNYRGAGGTAPIVASAPVVSGLNMVDETLTTTNGTYTGSPVDSYTYQWQMSTDGGTNWSSIGTNSTTYVLVSADSGNLVRCRVTATNAFGSVQNASNSLSIVTMDLVNLQSYNPARFTLVSGKVSVWTEQNLTTTWTQGFDPRRPTLTGGVPVFPGGGSFMQRTGGDVSAVNYTLYAVVRNTLEQDFRAIFSGASPNNWFSFNANRIQAALKIGGVDYYTGNLAATGKRTNVISIRVTGGNNVRVYVNDRIVHTPTPVTFSGQTTSISVIMGLLQSTGWSIGGPLNAFCMTSTQVSDAQHTDIINGLYNTYNLSSNQAADAVIGMGDSNTAGTGGVSYLVGLNTQSGLATANCGVSGARLIPIGGSVPTQSIYTRRTQFITKPGKDWTVIMGGTNDVNTGVSASDYQYWYNLMVQEYVNYGCDPQRLIIVTPPYILGNDLATQLNEYRDVCAGLATTYNTKYINFLDWMRNNGGDSLLVDRLHLNQTGQNGLQALVYAQMIS